MAILATCSNQRTLHPCRDYQPNWLFTGAALLIVGGLMAAARGAESGESIALRNLTSVPITQVYILPAGQNTFSADQIALIPGGAVDHDEILKLTGISPGRYLLRVTDNTGRGCWVCNIILEANQVVPVQDKDLTDCDP
jgi:hypothetical protein